MNLQFHSLKLTLKLALSILPFLISFSFADISSQLKTLTGKEHVKIVFSWHAQSLFGMPESGGSTSEKLLAYDSKTGLIDTLQSKLANYQRPLITHDGKHIIYTELESRESMGSIYKINWEKDAKPELICEGFAGVLYYDETTKKEYALFSSGFSGNYPVNKVDINNPADITTIFNANLSKIVCPHWLCVSSDLKAIGNVWGWGVGGSIVYNINGSPLVDGNGGCWSTMPYDTSYRLIRLADGHDTWSVFGPKSGAASGIKIGDCTNPPDDAIEHLKFASYSKNILCMATGLGDSQKGGRITIAKLDSTLCKVLDFVTIDNSTTYGFPDLWAGDSSALSSKFNTTKKQVLQLNPASIVNVYTLQGKMIFSSVYKNVDSKLVNFPAGTYVLRTGNIDGKSHMYSKN